jgi:AraC-like DNA-binding protein
MRTEVRDSFLTELSTKVEKALSIEQVIDKFNDAVVKLTLVCSKKWRGSNVMILESTLQYLKENYFESLPLPDVARKSGFSVPVFTRIFKQTTGTSYLSYLRSIRINNAKQLLISTDLTLEQIARSCGFKSAHHLIRSFKKVIGQTPGTFRKINTGLL